MRVFFLDVGQGTSNVIHISKGRGIIIDTGRDYSVLKRTLHKLKINIVSLLIISHCDQDHWGGATELLADTTISVERICFHVDHKTQKTAFWHKLEEMLDKGEIDLERQLIELCCVENPRRLWKSQGTVDVEIKILAPTFAQIVRSIMKVNSNFASGVIVLHVNERVIVFAGDAHYLQWEAISDTLGKPLECDIIAVPHHAGIIWDDQWKEGDVVSGLERLYKTFVKPKYAIVSVGTSNQYGHPKESVIQALRKAGVTVLCTQMTTKCNPDLETVRVSPVLPLLVNIPCASVSTRDQTNSKESRNVACAGTVVVDLTVNDLTINRLKQHQDGIVSLRRPLPLCRK